MGKSAVRLSILAIVGATLVVVPSITPAKAANGEVEKNKKKSQKSLASSNSRPASPSWPPPMDDDFDRKNAGGAGGM